MQQHVLLADRREHIALMVLHAFGNARHESGPKQIGTCICDQLGQISHADHAWELDGFGLCHTKFAHDQCF